MTAVPKKDAKILKKATVYVERLMEGKMPASIYFHNFGYSMLIFKEGIQLAKKMKLEKTEVEHLSLALLFVNTGYIKDYIDPIKHSKLYAENFLQQENYPIEKLGSVLELISIASQGEAPKNLLEKILIDASNSYLGLKKFRSRRERLKKEKTENIAEFKVSDEEWELINHEKLNHIYFTQVASDRYEERLKKNRAKAKNRAKKARKEEAKRIDNLSVPKNKAALTMFKTTLRNHIDLTAIADQKSNMMLSVNALLLTISMPIFASYLPEKMYLLAPSIVFMLTCIITMVFATLSTRPIKMDGKTNLEKLTNGKSNLFFFGNFYKIDLEPYRQAMKRVIANPEYLGDSIINDLYYLGNSLGDKFKYLRWCYNTFITGICLSLVSFLCSYFLIF